MAYMLMILTCTGLQEGHLRQLPEAAKAAQAAIMALVLVEVQKNRQVPENTFALAVACRSGRQKRYGWAMDCLLRQYIWELIEEAISELRNENEDYGKLMVTRANLDKEVAEILARLNPDEQETFSQYQTATHLVWGMEKVHIYLRGFKDCYRFYRWIQM